MQFPPVPILLQPENASKITIIEGADGCGKSTLIKILAKNLNYNYGSIKLEGKELNSYSLKELASILAIVYQKNETPREITVYDMVSFARLPYQNIFFKALLTAFAVVDLIFSMK